MNGRVDANVERSVKKIEYSNITKQKILIAADFFQYLFGICIPEVHELKGIPQRVFPGGNLRACIECLFSVCLIVDSAGG